MHLSTARIAPLDGRADVDPELVLRLLWRHRSTVRRVEHIRIRSGAGCLRIAAFTVSTDQYESDDIVRKLINLTISCAPELNRWRLL